MSAQQVSAPAEPATMGAILAMFDRLHVSDTTSHNVSTTSDMSHLLAMYDPPASGGRAAVSSNADKGALLAMFDRHASGGRGEASHNVSTTADMSHLLAMYDPPASGGRAAVSSNADKGALLAMFDGQRVSSTYTYAMDSRNMSSVMGSVRKVRRRAGKAYAKEAVGGSLSSYLSAPTWIRSALSSRVVQSSKGVLSFVGGTLASVYVGGTVQSLTGSELAGRLAGECAVHILRSVPAMIRDVKSGKARLGRVLVGVAAQTAATSLAGGMLGDDTFVKQFTGTVVGTLVGDTFRGYMEGVGRVQPSSADTDRVAADTLVDEQLRQAAANADGTEGEKLLEMNRNRSRLMQGAAAAAIAAGITAKLMAGGNPLPGMWMMAKKSKTVRSLLAAGITSSVSPQLGALSGFVHKQAERVMLAAGVRDVTVVPKAVQKRIRLRILEETLYRLTLADVSRVVASTAVRSTFSAATSTAVNGAAQWNSVAEAQQDIAAMYESTKGTVGAALESAHSSAYSLRDVVAATLTPGPQTAATGPAAAAATAATAEAQRQGGRAKMLEERDARLEVRMEAQRQRAQANEVSQEEFEERTAGEAGRWLTKEMVNAVDDFKQTKFGEVAEMFQGKKMRGVGITAAQMYAEAQTGAGLTGHAKRAFDAYKDMRRASDIARTAVTGTKFTARALNIAHADQEDTQRYEDLDDAVHDVLPDLPNLDPSTLIRNAVGSATLDAMHEATQFEMFETAMAGAGYHPYRSRLGAAASVTLGTGVSDAIDGFVSYWSGVASKHSMPNLGVGEGV